jgi:RNA polymerase sigma factor (sigma-70 family)
MEIPGTTDAELLADWLTLRREPAFHALVSRYAPLVHSAAKRICGDDALAADASQLVFILLAQKAKSLVSHPSLAGWLHVTAVMQTRNLIDKSRRESRKRQLFQSAMETESQSHPDTSWQEIQPVLDDVLNTLSENDREAILLRFYRSLSVKEIAATLGIATDAAQKRLDRATERLREKLTRRGVTTAGSLSTVMLAGFSTDAQAAVISTSVLSSKAIAASSATSVGLFATLTAMKATTYIAPAALIVLSGTWLVSQRLELAALDQRSKVVSQPMNPSQATGKNPINDSKPLDPSLDLPTQIAESALANDSKPLDPFFDLPTLIAESALADKDPGAMLRFQKKYIARFTAMSSEELGSLIGKLLTLGATDKDALSLAKNLLKLSLHKDFPNTFERFQAEIEAWSQNDRVSVELFFRQWIEQNPAAAPVWLDQQVAAGKLDAKSLDEPHPLRVSFESDILNHLVKTDPAAAAKRLDSLPESERKIAIPLSYRIGTFDYEQARQMVELIRSHLPENEQFYRIRLFAGSKANEDLSKAAGFIDSIKPTPGERSALAQNLGFKFYGEKPDVNALDELRSTAASIAPQEVDAATGQALGFSLENGTGLNFTEAAALALHYREAGAGDALLVHFINNSNRLNDNDKAAARLLAEKVSDPQQRATLLDRLK